MFSCPYFKVLFKLDLANNTLKITAKPNGHDHRQRRWFFTDKIKAILSGIGITAILQSSSVVSLMVLAFVGAGIIELKNAIGIIIGSNLGTTLTGWVVAYFGFSFNIESFALPFLAFGGLSMVFFQRRKTSIISVSYLFTIFQAFHS